MLTHTSVVGAFVVLGVESPVIALIVFRTSISPDVVTSVLYWLFGWTLSWMSCFICAGVRSPLMVAINAASPDTWGQAMLVPDILAYALSGIVDRISDPGAITWT